MISQQNFVNSICYHSIAILSLSLSLHLDRNVKGSIIL